jgi:hypothetical protein
MLDLALTVVGVNGFAKGDGQPSFSSLQNFGDGAAAILFYAFEAPCSLAQITQAHIG